VTEILVRRGRVADYHLDRHELDALLVPYDVTRTVVDQIDDGRLDRYRENFAPGVFAAQVADPARHRGITLRDGHTNRDRAGYALELSDDAAGVRGRFRILPNAFDDIAMMLDDGVDGISVGFLAVRTRIVTDPDGDIRRRTRGLLDHVAIEPVPAYDDARVLALRDGDPDADGDVATPARDDLAAYLTTRRS
jgi:HK97 family phage prohead protease